MRTWGLVDLCLSNELPCRSDLRVGQTVQGNGCGANQDLRIVNTVPYGTVAKFAVR